MTKISLYSIGTPFYLVRREKGFKYMVPLTHGPEHVKGLERGRRQLPNIRTNIG